MPHFARLSNEETLEYTPIDAAGQAADWGDPGAFVLPLRTIGQQILSIVNTATVVEREVRLNAVAVNGPDFDERREGAMASDATMVRDTEKGLRYLSKEGAPEGERVVQGLEEVLVVLDGLAPHVDAEPLLVAVELVAIEHLLER